MDLIIPAEEKLARAYTNEVCKYSYLVYQLQLREMYDLKSNVNVKVNVNGLVEKHLVDNTERLDLERHVISISQK